MSNDNPNSIRLRMTRLQGIPLLAWLVLGLGLLATALGWFYVDRQVSLQNQMRLANEVDQSISKLHERLLLCESVVHGTRGLYSASKSVERDEWRVYGQGLFEQEEYPVIRALFSISYVKNTNLDHYLKITRDDDMPGFAITPSGEREVYCPIKYIQSRGSKSGLLGLDANLMPVLHQGLFTACDSDASTLTRPVRLTVEENEPPEVLLVLPIYRNGARKETVAERRDSLDGWVAALLPIAGLTDGLGSKDGSRVSFQIFDDSNPNPLLYDSAATKPTLSQPVEKTAEVRFGGRTWRIVFHSGTHLSSGTEAAFPLLVLVSGGLGSFLLFNLVCSLAIARAGAFSLRERDQQLRLALQSAQMGVWQLDDQTDTLTWSDDLIGIFGLNPGEQPRSREAFFHLIASKDRARVADSIARSLENSLPYHEVYQIVWADGGLRWIDDRGSVYRNSDGENAKLVGVAMDITARKLSEIQVEQLNRQLVETSRAAGMSEIATGVLHNVGNVLNSVNVSASLLRDSFTKSQIHNLLKATNLLRDHAADSISFLTNDPKGQRLPGFLIKLGDHIAAEQRAWEQELTGLGTNIEHIKEIVTMQQNYARLNGVIETLSAEDLVKDALHINESALNRHGVDLVQDFQSVPLVTVDKHKVLQILINLLRNSKHALDHSGRINKVLTLTIRTQEKDRVLIQVRDNGIGIAPENISRIFQHGFTTKSEGHGFGLHSGANAAREMGGNLSAQSDGVGCGAVFTLELPAAAAISQASTASIPLTPA